VRKVQSRQSEGGAGEGRGKRVRKAPLWRRLVFLIDLVGEGRGKHVRKGVICAAGKLFGED
jgi:hypothetical protein